jgi:hypothetical protein
MITRSCTNQLQRRFSYKYGIQVIDKPGFYLSSDVNHHISVQKQALSAILINGVYIAVRIGRTDEMADTINTIMNFLGTDEVRIIVTHVDTIDHEVDTQDLRQQLFQILDIPVDNIAVIGKQTSCGELEEFVKDTLHTS